MAADPRATVLRSEERIGHPISPPILRRMAEDARDEAARHDAAAERARNRADVYDDLADERSRESGLV